MSEILGIAIVLVVVFLIIEFVINKNLRIIILKLLKKKVFKKNIYVKDVIVIVTFLIIINYSISLFNQIKENIDFINTDLSEQYNELEKKQDYSNEQFLKYSELMKNEMDLNKCMNPYIPEGFSYLEGEWNNGFVIEDVYKNQFVWIPCCNVNNNENIPILEKKIFFKENGAVFFNCYEGENIEKFLNSCLENGGFYISRFEIGNENNLPVSKSGIKIWTNIKSEEAKVLAEKMYDNINSELINGYAFDTAVSFIYDDIDINDIKKSSGITGNSCYKKIYDLIDNCLEWTSEMRNSSIICRGTIFNDNSNSEPIFFCDRFSRDGKLILENLGFRTIIYK